MRRAGVVAAAALVAASVSACLAFARPAAQGTTFTVAAGHRLAGFGFDRDWLTLAEDSTSAGACPEVELIDVRSGKRDALTELGGASCRFGGSFWARPNARPIGNAIVKALWVLRRGQQAIAVKASTTEPEVVLDQVSGGQVLGPVAAKNWLRLFVTPGGVVSGNQRTLYSGPTTTMLLALDKQEHAVSVDASGAIAMWHAHGARYGVVADAHARAAAMSNGHAFLLRDNAPWLDVRALSGKLLHSWRIPRGARPLLDVSGNKAVYLVGRSVHELDVRNGRDVVVATAPKGSTLVDAQIEPRFLAYGYRGGPGGAGRVVVVPR